MELLKLDGFTVCGVALVEHFQVLSCQSKKSFVNVQVAAFFFFFFSTDVFVQVAAYTTNVVGAKIRSMHVETARRGNSSFYLLHVQIYMYSFTGSSSTR